MTNEYPAPCCCCCWPDPVKIGLYPTGWDVDTCSGDLHWTSSLNLVVVPDDSLDNGWLLRGSEAKWLSESCDGAGDHSVGGFTVSLDFNVPATIEGQAVILSELEFYGRVGVDNDLHQATLNGTDLGIRCLCDIDTWRCHDRWTYFRLNENFGLQMDDNTLQFNCENWEKRECDFMNQLGLICEFFCGVHSPTPY